MIFSTTQTYLLLVIIMLAAARDLQVDANLSSANDTILIASDEFLEFSQEIWYECVSFLLKNLYSFFASEYKLSLSSEKNI